ncbi:MAG: hypothetical protein KDD54_00620 [Flavobacteriales bacterium]|nr:hypothetical protein [Flavobacteriales bacterium]
MPKKFLIISYFFPPCNLTAANRVGSWVNHLSDFDWYPVVITRNWDHPISNPSDVLLSSGGKLRVTRTGKSEIRVIPYKASLRDHFYTRFGNGPLAFISKGLTLLQMLKEYISPLSGVNKAFYYEALKLLRENPEIESVLISGNPFEQFYIGYKLNRKTGVRWLADYRDDWSTSELKQPEHLFSRIFLYLNKRREKKWVSSASRIVSVSPLYVKKISAFTGIKGTVVFNGYDDDIEHGAVSHINPSLFRITYNGSLYDTQPIEPFLEVMKKVIRNFREQMNIVVEFPGLAYSVQQVKRVQDAMKGYEDHIRITPRLPREEVLALQRASDVLLMLAHTGLKGIPSSKVFEYIGLHKPVLLFPDDGDILKEILQTSGLGVICNDELSLQNTLEQMMMAKIESGQCIRQPANEEGIRSYSRRQQCKKLVEVLNDL